MGHNDECVYEQSFSKEKEGLILTADKGRYTYFLNSLNAEVKKDQNIHIREKWASTKCIQGNIYYEEERVSR